MQCIKFGIIGPGTISHRFVKGLRHVPQAKLAAVASRDQQKALRYADEYQIPFVFTDYEALFLSEQVDAVYIATPPHTHFDLVMEALKHHKHVICEKPFMLNHKQAETAFAYAKEQNCVLMEAMKAVFLPVTKQVEKWLADGEIGEIKYMEASYSYLFPHDDLNHWVFKKEYSGGGMFDVGCYPLAYTMHLCRSKITETKAMHVDGVTGTDEITQLLIRYENGMMASVRGGIGVDTRNDAMIYGTKGYISIPDFWKAERAYRSIDGQVEVFEELHDKAEFRYEIAHFTDLILQGKRESDIWSSAQSIAMLKLMEASVDA